MVAGGVLFSGFSWAHHDARSGYHHVVSSNADYVDSGRLWGGQTEIGGFERKLNILLAELLTLFRARRYHAVFYIYPEVSALFFSAPLLKLMGKRVIYALHRGEKYWGRDNGSLLFQLKRHNLKYVDHFIMLSTQQKRVFTQHFPGRVSVIPHGIWLDRPSIIRQPVVPPRVCVVGDNFRDYDLLSQIIKRAALHFPELSFDLVGMQYPKLGEAAKASTVTCHPRLSQAEYTQVIADATFMLLPLHFATANNALLEALALGVPVICNRIDGVTDYVPDDVYLFDGIEQLCDMITTRLQMSVAQRASESAALINYAEQNFSWTVIRERVLSLCLQGGEA